MRKMKSENLKMRNGALQFITHYTEQYTYLDSVRMALEGGCRWIQLRMKDTPVEEILAIAIETKNYVKAMAPHSLSTTM